MEDIERFYTKSKVAICLAITDSFHFLDKLKDGGILSEEEALELQGDTRNVHRVVYECLCGIEKKDVSAQHFLKFLFQKSFLKKYPDLNSVCAEYKEGKYRNSMQSTADEDKDPQIFAQNKVRLCLTITDRFPFLHGLQDLTILSESESLKLQADERPVSRVIYESLSLIEKKGMKVNIVYEYIFQQCYLKLYPGLQDILRESSGELVAPFNGRQYPIFNIATDLVEFFDHNKTYISEAINERFPFLHGLHDLRLLSYLQLLKLQADRGSTKEVLYEALSHIHTIHDIESFFAYVFQEFYLKLYPDLQLFLQCLNAALTLDICPPNPVSSENEISDTQEQDSQEASTVAIKGEVNELPESDSSEPSPDIHNHINITSVNRSSNHTDSLALSGLSDPCCSTYSCEVPSVHYLHDLFLESPFISSSFSFAPIDLVLAVSYEEETRGTQEQDPRVIPEGEIMEIPRQESSEPSPDETREAQEQDSKEPSSGSDNTLSPSARKLRECRTNPISYSEPPDFDLEVVNGKKKHKENPKRHRNGKRKAYKTNSFALRKSSSDVRPDPVQVTRPLSISLEFPKQVLNEKFKVRCGDKTGIFKKKHWTGDSRKDLCIHSEGKTFSVITFERYGGKEASKNWKKSIQCEKIKLENLIEAGILKQPIWTKKHK